MIGVTSMFMVKIPSLYYVHNLRYGSQYIDLGSHFEFKYGRLSKLSPVYRMV